MSNNTGIPRHLYPKQLQNQRGNTDYLYTIYIKNVHNFMHLIDSFDFSL